MRIEISGTAVGAVVVSSLFFADPCFAQSFKAGDRVEASPFSEWKACEVTNVLPGGYGVACGPRRTEYLVPDKRVRPLSAPSPTQAQVLAPVSGQTQSAPGRVTQAADSGALASGRYECWAAGGVAGALNLEIKSDATYAGNGKTGVYAYDPQTRNISFQSGPWAGFYGKRLEPGKIGISSRPGGFYSTSCDLK